MLKIVKNHEPSIFMRKGVVVYTKLLLNNVLIAVDADAKY